MRVLLRSSDNELNPLLAATDLCWLQEVRGLATWGGPSATPSILRKELKKADLLTGGFIRPIQPTVTVLHTRQRTKGTSVSQDAAGAKSGQMPFSQDGEAAVMVPNLGVPDDWPQDSSAGMIKVVASQT